MVMYEKRVVEYYGYGSLGKTATGMDHVSPCYLALIL